MHTGGIIHFLYQHYGVENISQLRIECETSKIFVKIKDDNFAIQFEAPTAYLREGVLRRETLRVWKFINEQYKETRQSKALFKILAEELGYNPEEQYLGKP